MTSHSVPLIVALAIDDTEGPVVPLPHPPFVVCLFVLRLVAQADLRLSILKVSLQTED